MMQSEGFPISEISVLSDDFQEYLFSSDKVTKAKYTELPLIERVIDGQKYHNLYMIRPNLIYKCHLELPDTLPAGDFDMQLKTYLNSIGLALLGTPSLSTIYIVYHGLNVVYIKKGSSITVNIKR